MATIVPKWEQEYRAEVNKMTFPELWEHFVEEAHQPDDWDGGWTNRQTIRCRIVIELLEKFFRDAGLLSA